MPSRSDIISKAIDECLKEIYSYVKPSVDFEEFSKENKNFIERENEYYKLPKETRPNYHEYMGPKPYEFYYLPKDILKDITESYVYAYKLDNHQELLDTISTLKKYCESPIVDKYIEDHTDEYGYHPGYKGYDHPDNLSLCLMNLITDSNLNLGNNIGTDIVNLANKLQDKFFEFLDMAGEFYDWNGELNTFNVNVYLGPSPNSNKEAVIKNWKEYRNQDIEIDEEQIKKEYYGDDE